jgi:glutathione S-transferase
MKGKEPFYCVGDVVSMADLVWACALFNLKLCGNEYLWEDLVKVTAYV